MPTNNEIVDVMCELLGDCTDRTTGELNHNLLAELTCIEYNAFEFDNVVPERFFELALSNFS